MYSLNKTGLVASLSRWLFYICLTPLNIHIVLEIVVELILCLLLQVDLAPHCACGATEAL